MTAEVLIVDDSLTVRMDLKETLETAGLHPVLCATLEEARAALAREPFSLVILDLLLPDGDGIDLLDEIRQTPSAEATAVMLLSTETDVRDRIRGLSKGADEYVGKPYEPGYVAARALELVRRRRPTAASTTETVLIIDDSPTFREELRQALARAGYSVIVAETGEEGLQQAANLRPNAVIVDGVLPGIDGPTVIRRIRFDAALRGLPCLLLTASDDGNAEIRALDAGADTFVRKDEDIAVILARLRAAIRSSSTPAADRNPASLFGPKKILAVDDSETYLQEIASVLRSEGYEVALARSGEEAVELLSVQSVDCILLDLLMPGMDGQETCRRVKAVPIARDIPIIMLTAREDPDAMIGSLSAGADDYISKSSSLEVLRARVRAQLRRKQFEDENRLFREQLLRKELEASEARAAKTLAEARAALTEELEWKNQELEAFSYSVAHDLRAPLRSIDGFSQALLEDYSEKLDEEGQQYLCYLRESAQQMAQLINDLLELSRLSRTEFRQRPVDLTAIAREIEARLRFSEPHRQVVFNIADGLVAEGDATLISVALQNLLGNAWKFTRDRRDALIELFGTEREDARVFVVRDNGAGFDMAYVSKLFGVFQRLHSASEFEGTGVGLATVQRVVRRHGGRIWAEGKVGHGATFSFTLASGPQIRRGNAE